MTDREPINTKRLEELLEESERRLLTVVENLGAGLGITDKNGIYTYVNSARAIMLGYSPEEMIGKPQRFFTHEDSLEKRDLEIAKRKRGESSSYEVNFVSKDGRTMPVLAIGTPLFDEQGEYAGSYGLTIDISERKKIEDQIGGQVEFMNNIMDSLTHPFYVIDANDYTIVMANPASHLDSLSEGSTCYALTHNRNEPCGAQGESCPVSEIRRTKKPVVVEHVHYDKDGIPRTFEVHGYPILDSEGNISQIIEYSFDITDRKQVEETLRESEERYRTLVELARDGIIIADMKGVVRSINPTVVRVFGYSEDEIVGKRFSNLPFFRARDIPKYMRIFNSAIRGKVPKPFEIAYIRKDGSSGWGEVNAGQLKESDKTVGVQAIIRDITERKQLEDREDSLRSFILRDLSNKFTDARKLLELLEQTDLSENQKEYLEKLQDVCRDVTELIEKAQ